jgi:hypothetical protein
MSKLFKAVIGFGIAFYIWSPTSFAAHFDTAATVGLRAQIEAAHPHEKLLAQFAALTR